MTLDELQVLLLRYELDILHFSGHGTLTGGLIFVDTSNNAVELSGEAFMNILRVLHKNKRLHTVFLNAAYSEKTARDIANYVDFAIGYPASVSAETALEFAAKFLSSPVFWKHNRRFL